MGYFSNGVTFLWMWNVTFKKWIVQHWLCSHVVDTYARVCTKRSVSLTFLCRYCRTRLTITLLSLPVHSNIIWQRLDKHSRRRTHTPDRINQWDWYSIEQRNNEKEPKERKGREGREKTTKRKVFLLRICIVIWIMQDYKITFSKAELSVFAFVWVSEIVKSKMWVMHWECTKIVRIHLTVVAQDMTRPVYSILFILFLL